MERELSSQNEHYLAELVASGVFPSREAALNAAVEALRIQATDVRCTFAVSTAQGLSPVDDEHWRRLDRLIDAVSG
jgi:hypothetical protein